MSMSDEQQEVRKLLIERLRLDLLTRDIQVWPDRRRWSLHIHRDSGRPDRFRSYPWPPLPGPR